jgi:haloalkane dehalogenase
LYLILSYAGRKNCLKPMTLSSEFRITSPASTSELLPEMQGQSKKLALLPRPEWLSEAQWPFPTFAINHQGHRLAVTDVGQGPSLLFIHAGLWSFIWRDLLLRLQRDYRCIAIDAPGTGRSDRSVPDLIRLERSAEAVATVIDVLDLQDFVLVLHDLGGVAGLAGALPFADRVRGIAALNTFGWRPDHRGLRFMLRLMSSGFMREFDVLTQLLPRVTSSLFGAGRYLDQPGRRVLRAGIDHEALRAFHYYMRDALTCDGLFQRVEKALETTFKGLPFLSIFGERNDPFGFQRRWRELFPHAQQAIVTNGYHFPMCDNPQITAELIRSWHQERVIPTLT